MTAGPGRPLWHRRRILIAAALTVTLVGAAEASARRWLENALSGATSTLLGGHASIGVGARPALIDLTTGSVPTLTIHADGVDVCTIHGATINATFQDARRQNGHLAVASSQASILLPPQALAFTPASVGIGGFAAPAGFTGGLSSKAAFSQKLPTLPLAMRAQTVTVRSDGLLLGATGSASGPQPARETTPAAGPRSC
jgi:hypothetical protein